MLNGSREETHAQRSCAGCPSGQVIGPSQGTSRPYPRSRRAAWVSRSGVPAMGIDPAEPAEETVTTSAPPSTDVESITRKALTVLNDVPLTAAEIFLTAR